ncbi:MAG: relaxase/mobilization nuclease domain-containing protein [Pseudomonas sp.]
MISKIMAFSAEFRNRIEYEFAARKKDKEKINYVEYVGGNIVSGNPYFETMIDGKRKVFVDIEPIIQEFEVSAASYKGRGEKICGHYVLSLKKGEALDRKEWLAAVHAYMRDLGYDETTKYVAVIHRDKPEEHVHIVTSRVRLVEQSMSENRPELGANFQLVPTSNDYRKGMDIARVIEAEYGLSTPVTQDYSKETKAGFDLDKDQAHILRGISKDITKKNNIRTMTQLINIFASRGIQIKVAENSKGEIVGINYRLDRDDGRWISGSKVLDKLSWPGLQRDLGISYVPSRDDHTLGRGMGISNPDATSVKNDGALFRAYIKIKAPSEELYTYVRKRKQSVGFHREDKSIYLGFNFGTNLSFSSIKLKRHEVEVEQEKRRFEALLKLILKMVKDINQTFFGECFFHIDLQADTSEYMKTALRLNIPVGADAAGEYVLEKDCESQIQAQVKKQIGNLVSTCLRNERSNAPAIELWTKQPHS